MTTQIASQGRGGAGNMTSAAGCPKLTTWDLQTPTLKTPVVTTGRGGMGNMARNNDPYETRLRQDVEAIPRRSSSGTQHSGRGGAGNVFTEADARVARDAIALDGSAVDDAHSNHSSSSGFAAKGKNWLLQLGKK